MADNSRMQGLVLSEEEIETISKSVENAHGCSLCTLNYCARTGIPQGSPNLDWIVPVHRSLLKNLTATIRDLDKTITNKEDKIYRLEAELEARRATDGLSVIEQQNKELRAQLEQYDAYEAGMAKFRQEYQVMLSALETIKTYERCGELHGQTCASIARETITQVKGEQHG